MILWWDWLGLCFWKLIFSCKFNRWCIEFSFIFFCSLLPHLLIIPFSYSFKPVCGLWWLLSFSSLIHYTILLLFFFCLVCGLWLLKCFSMEFGGTFNPLRYPGLLRHGFSVFLALSSANCLWESVMRDSFSISAQELPDLFGLLIVLLHCLWGCFWFLTKLIRLRLESQ